MRSPKALLRRDRPATVAAGRDKSSKKPSLPDNYERYLFSTLERSQVITRDDFERGRDALDDLRGQRRPKNPMTRVRERLARRRADQRKRAITASPSVARTSMSVPTAVALPALPNTLVGALARESASPAPAGDEKGSRSSNCPPAHSAGGDYAEFGSPPAAIAATTIHLSARRGVASSPLSLNDRASEASRSQGEWSPEGPRAPRTRRGLRNPLSALWVFIRGPQTSPKADPLQRSGRPSLRPTRRPHPPTRRRGLLNPLGTFLANHPRLKPRGLGGAILACAALYAPSVAYATEAPCPNAALRTGPSANLPDCRAYEQVSPAEKDGGSGGVLNYDYPGQATSERPVQSGHPMQSVPDGSAITYTGEPFFNVEAKGDGSSEEDDKFFELYTSRRSSSGWSTVNGDTLPPEEAPVPVLPSSAEETPHANVLEETPSGSKVFFLDEKHEPGITPDSTAAEGKPDLYEYDIQTGDTTDLTVDTKGGEHAEVQGIVGIGGEGSEEGVYVYFVARGKLAPGATSGLDNLYLRHHGAITFIAALSPEDELSFDTQGLGGVVGVVKADDWAIPPAGRTAEVSPNGRYVAFPSHAALTSAVNESYEIYLYDARAAEDHEQAIVCISCSATGAVVPEAKLPSSPRALINGANRQRSVLSDGRVFFTTTASLVPQDVNHQADVYEWEDGASHLISGGTSATSFAVFTDASSNGSDVFFTTGQSLVPQDQDEITDLYDARENGGASPSPAPACPAESQCPGGTSHALAESPRPSSLSTGLEPPPPPVNLEAKPGTTKPLSRAQKLAKALRGCRKDRKRVKRKACEAAARRKYAPKKASKKKGSK